MVFPEKIAGYIREHISRKGPFFKCVKDSIPHVPGFSSFCSLKCNVTCYFQNVYSRAYVRINSDCLRNFRNPGKSGKFSPKTCRTKFPGISGNIFRGFPGIPEIPGNFSGNLGVFLRTRAVEQCTRP